MNNLDEIPIVIAAESAKKVFAMAKKHRFEPVDIVNTGLALACLILDERELGHEIRVIDAEEKVIEEARNIIDNAFSSSSLRASIADLDPDLPNNRKTDGPSSGMSCTNLVIAKEAAKKLLATAKKHRFEPVEILNAGLTVLFLILDERELGHKTGVMDAEGKVISLILLPETLTEPKIIDEEARNIIENAFSSSSSLRASIADLDPDLPNNRKTDGPSLGMSR